MLERPRADLRSVLRAEDPQRAWTIQKSCRSPTTRVQLWRETTQSATASPRDSRPQTSCPSSPILTCRRRCSPSSTTRSPKPSMCRRVFPSPNSARSTISAYDKGLKGCTTFRPNPVTGAVLSGAGPREDPRIVAFWSEKRTEVALAAPYQEQEDNQPLIIDGAHGEGGGQILRTALSLSAITSRAFRLVNIRAKRRNPGLQPQHLSATRAAAAISGATLAGDQPRIERARLCPNPSAATRLISLRCRGNRRSWQRWLHAFSSCRPSSSRWLWPKETSTVVVLGGTHQDWAPTFDDLANAYLPALRRMGLSADAELKHWGWYPAGGGEVVCKIKGGPDQHRRGASWPQPIEALERGPLIRITGRAVAANLPAHIAQRMADRARAALSDLDVPVADRTSARRGRSAPGREFFCWPNTRPWRRVSPSMGVRESRPKPLRTRRSPFSASITPRVPPSNCTLPTSFCCRSPSPLVPPPSPWHVRPRTSPPMPGRLSSSVSPKSRSSRGS